MKLRLNKKSGFTLVEILVVIAILATLAVAGWGAYGMIENNKLNKQAQLEVEVMAAGMYAYQADGNALPWGRGDEMSSNKLYETLTGDKDNDGEPDVDKHSKVADVYCPQLVAIQPGSDTELEGIPCHKVTLPQGGAKYVIIDPWGRTYRYRLGYEQSITSKGKGKNGGKKTNGPGMNPDFDIFSLGPDGEGDCMTKTGSGNDDNISNIKTW